MFSIVFRKDSHLIMPALTSRFLLLLFSFLASSAFAGSDECKNLNGKYSITFESTGEKVYFSLEQEDCFQINRRSRTANRITPWIIDNQLRTEWETQSSTYSASYQWDPTGKILLFRKVSHNRDINFDLIYDGQIDVAENGNLIVNTTKVTTPSGRTLRGGIDIWEREE